MDAQDLLTRPVAILASTLPRAAAVFRRYGIDVCRNGATLAEAAARKGLDPAALGAEVATAAAPPALPEPMGTPALLDHILERFHEGHRQDLPMLEALAEKVEMTHAAHPRCPAGLTATLAEIRAELESHMEKEEWVLFPMMREGRSAILGGPIACMSDEHADFLARVDRIAELTHGFEAPAGACATWRALTINLAHVVGEMREHVRVEEELLFPRFTNRFRKD